MFRIACFRFGYPNVRSGTWVSDSGLLTSIVQSSSIHHLLEQFLFILGWKRFQESSLWYFLLITGNNLLQTNAKHVWLRTSSATQDQGLTMTKLYYCSNTNHSLWDSTSTTVPPCAASHDSTLTHLCSQIRFHIPFMTFIKSFPWSCLVYKVLWPLSAFTDHKWLLISQTNII